MNQNYSIYVGIALSDGCDGDKQGGIGLVIYDETPQCIEQQRIQVLEVTDKAELELCALAEALEYAQDGDIIYSSSAFCVNGYNEWLDNWKARGWRKSNKKPVANRKLWRQVDELRSTKYVEVYQASGRNPSGQIFKAVELAKECFNGEDF